MSRDEKKNKQTKREGGKGIRNLKKRFANPVFVDPVRYTCTLIQKLPPFDNFLDIR